MYHTRICICIHLASSKLRFTIFPIMYASHLRICIHLASSKLRFAISLLGYSGCSPISHR
ncbi:hypothetical protein Hanom_Chr12g01092631 [Helianthus anomalus]